MAVESTGVTAGDEPPPLPERKIVGRAPDAVPGCGRFSSKGVLVSNLITVVAPAVVTERRASLG
jgi:hypothetical protein